MGKNTTSDQDAATQDAVTAATAEYQARIAALEAQVSPQPAVDGKVDDHPIVAKIILRKNEFRAAAIAESKKTFNQPIEPTKILLSERAHALYQDWAKAKDAEHIGQSVKTVEEVTKVKGQKDIVELVDKPYEAGDTRLHEVFAGLPIVLDVDLPGESVVIA